mmetsp:Transcript_72956/g.117624  ORF Transcript_72956/g.117624 Transcript_72956/m.117624 type:complete len:327 (+) Transcript_72956:458-1438(+)
MCLAVFLQLPLQGIHRLLKVVTLSIVLLLHVRVQVEALRPSLHVLAVQRRDTLLECFWLRDCLHAVAEIQLEALDQRQILPEPPLLRLDLLLQGSLLHLKLRDVESKLLVLPHVITELIIHGLCLSLHRSDVCRLRVDLRLELLDLVVQHKSELGQFLILLLEILDALLLVRDGLVSLLDLLLVGVLVLHQRNDPLFGPSALVLFLPNLFLLLRHLALEIVVILLMDAGLAPQSHLLILLLRQLLLVHLFQLLDLPVGILLELLQRLLVVLESLLLLLDNSVLVIPVFALDLVRIILHVVDDPRVLVQKRSVLSLPLLLFPLQVLS